MRLTRWKHHLSKYVGSGNSVLADATTVDLSGFDAVWASPPCQIYTMARTQGNPVSQYAQDYLSWSLSLPHEILWVENVASVPGKKEDFGKKWNAAQFLENPIQNRNRIIGGRYKDPIVYAPWKRIFDGVCPAILASEYKGSKNDKRRASRFYGRALTLEECAFHQGFILPKEWLNIPEGWTKTRYEWKINLYEGLGNGVPVFMAKAFGDVYE